MARTDLQYINLTDFSPGVYSKWGVSTVLGKDGSAQIDDGRGRMTYGCYGDPDGGLRPLPRKVKTFSTDFTERMFTTSLVSPFDISPVSDTKVGIIDFAVQPSTFATTDITSPAVDEPGGMLSSYPESSRLHPDTLYVLTSHRTANYQSIFQQTSFTGHLNGTAYTTNGALVGQFKQWLVSRLADGSASLPTVETQLQCRVAAAEWGDAAWADFSTRKYEYAFGKSPAVVYARDAWHAGTIAIGRSVPPVISPVTGNSISRADLELPGNITVVACLVSGFPYVEPDQTLVGWPSIFTVLHKNATRLPYTAFYANPVSSQVSTPNANYKYSIFTAYETPYYLIQHQDRFVGVIQEFPTGNTGTGDFFDPDGISTSTYTSNFVTEPSDTFRFSDYNAALEYDPTLPTGADNLNIWVRYDESKPAASVYSNASPSGVGCVMTMSNDMLIVKHNGGGALVRGSVGEASVVPAPSVPSTAGVSCVPVSTELGVVYGTSNGVALWAGTNGGKPEVQYVSNQLDGFFWSTGDSNEISVDRSTQRPGIAGRFGYQWPFVYAPNDWVMDTRTGGWFRLVDQNTDPNPYRHMFFDSNAQGGVYAARGCYDANYLDVVDLYDSNLPGNSFRWVSQPMVQSLNREVLVEEIILMAQGRGRVTITILGIDDDAEQREEFGFDSSDRPTRIVRNTSIQVAEMVVVIEAQGMFPDDPAPTVLAAHFGTRETTGLPRG